MKVLVHYKAQEELDKLEPLARKRFATVVDDLKRQKKLPSTEYRKMSGPKGLLEMRVKAISGIYRGLCGKIDQDLYAVVFFQKKTAKTPLRQIRLALKRLNELR